MKSATSTRGAARTDGVPRPGRPLYKPLLLGIGLTYLLIVLGGVVRLSGAGLACPDWPLCHGRIVPPPDPLVWIEWSHRLLASVVGLLVVGLTIAAWRAPQPGRLRRWLTLAVALLAAQVLLGGLTVLLELSPLVVIAHLATSQLFLAALIVSAQSAARRSPSSHPPLRRSSAGAAIIVLAIILSGGWVTGALADAACGGWPLCRGALLPSLEPRVLIQLLHRGLVAAGALALLLTWHRARAADRPARRLSAAALHLFWLQVLIGGAYILTGFPTWLAGLHLAAAAAIWGLVVALWAGMDPGRAAAAAGAAG